MAIALALVVVVVLAVGIALLVARLHGGKIPRFFLNRFVGPAPLTRGPELRLG